METNLDKRYQTLVVLWFAMLMNIGVFFVICFFVAPPNDNAGGANASPLLLFAFAAIGTFMVVLSFAVKRKLLERSVDRQDVTLVQKALILACVMCEVAALLGLVERLIFKNRDYYLLFLVALLGTALHFPKRDQLAAASYKSQSDFKTP